MIKTIISTDAAALSVKAAELIVELSNEILAKQDRFTIALSGGSTPKKLFQLLASPAYTDKIEWAKFHVFWGDERFVPFEDERNNGKMAFTELLQRVPVTEEHIHLMKTGISPTESVSDYEETLHRYFDGDDHSFDLVLLGLGDDGHTLSLFPGYPVVHEKDHWVNAFYLEEQEMYRITLTAGIVNKSANIAFLISGNSKSEALKEVIQGNPDPDKYPAQVISPEHGDLYWFLDEAAASKLA